MDEYIKVIKGVPVLFDQANMRHKYLLKETDTVQNLEQLFTLIENNYKFRPWIKSHLPS